MTIILPNPFEFESVTPDLAPWGSASNGVAQEVGTVAAIGQADAMVSTSDEFFPYRFGRKAAPALIPSAEVTAELEAGIAAIVAGVARKRSHIAFRSFASNSTFNFPSSVKA